MLITDLSIYTVPDPEAYFTTADGRELAKSVHYHNRGITRLDMACKQAAMPVVKVGEIIRLTNRVLMSAGICPVSNPILNPRNIDYENIKTDYQLKNKGDLVWLKMTSDGHLLCVACGADINLRQVPLYADCDAKDSKGKWRYSSSSIIVSKLQKKLLKRYVLCFPLRGIEDTPFSRHDIEVAVGRYLIAQGVPILDYYSHNYLVV